MIMAVELTISKIGGRQLEVGGVKSQWNRQQLAKHATVLIDLSWRRVCAL